MKLPDAEISSGRFPSVKNPPTLTAMSSINIIYSLSRDWVRRYWHVLAVHQSGAGHLRSFLFRVYSLVFSCILFTLQTLCHFSMFLRCCVRFLRCWIVLPARVCSVYLLLRFFLIFRCQLLSDWMAVSVPVAFMSGWCDHWRLKVSVYSIRCWLNSLLIILLTSATCFCSCVIRRSS